MLPQLYWMLSFLYFLSNKHNNTERLIKKKYYIHANTPDMFVNEYSRLTLPTMLSCDAMVIISIIN